MGAARAGRSLRDVRDADRRAGGPLSVGNDRAARHDARVAARAVSPRRASVARIRGPQGLLSAPIPGRPPALSPEQRGLIPEFLWHGAEAYGFRGSVWTCGRIAKVIEQEFGVSYHKGHVARLLKELHWTPQVPIRRAIQRDDAAIESWRSEVWPAEVSI